MGAGEDQEQAESLNVDREEEVVYRPTKYTSILRLGRSLRSVDAGEGCEDRVRDRPASGKQSSTGQN